MPIFLIIFIGSVIIYQVRLRQVGKTDLFKQDVEKYMRDDAEASFSRVMPIEDSMYIKLSEKDFPFKYHYNQDEKLGNDILRIQKKVQLNLAVPIIQTGIESNIDIKRRFGAANLQTVVDGEENFTRLIQHLNKWAGLLIEAGNEKDAETILAKAVEIGSDISETYILLLRIYNNTKRQNSADELMERVQLLPEIARKRVMATLLKSENQTNKG